jgi:hypothetical protein
MDVVAVSRSALTVPRTTAFEVAGTGSQQIVIQRFGVIVGARPGALSKHAALAPAPDASPNCLEDALLATVTAP